MKLTAHGKETAKKIKTYKDIRLDDYDELSESQRKALIRLGTYSMLSRAKFETNEVQAEMEQDSKEIEGLTEGKEILFSPYQTLDLITVNDALNIQITSQIETQKNRLSPALKTYARRIIKGDVVKLDNNMALKQEMMTEDTERFISHVMQLNKQNKSIEQIVEILVMEHSKDNKGEFYPLVEVLFRIIGVDCHKSRDGVNGERWDAMIRDVHRSIPIEIKSPGEEENISIKAIRQALENKIVLLSRKTYVTDNETSSFGDKSIQIDESMCSGCGLCARACPVAAITVEGGKAKLEKIDLKNLLVINKFKINPNIRGGSGTETDSLEQDYIQLMEPNEESATVLAEGVTLTGYGIVDNKLHVQVRFADILVTDNHGEVYLKNQNGEVVHCQYNVAFWDNSETDSYEEYVFNLPIDELNSYEIWGEFWTCNAGSIKGDWQVTFPLTD